MSRRSASFVVLLAILALVAAGWGWGGDSAGRGSAKLPAVKVGILQIIGGIESADRVERAIRAAAKAIGWPVLYCDGRGDPTQMTRCGDSLLDRGANAIVTIGIEPSLIAAPLRKAKRKGVPVIEVSGFVSPSPLYAGRYYPDEPLNGKLLARYLIKELNAKVTGEKTVATSDYPAKWSTLRTDELRKLVKGTGIKIVASQTGDPTNLIEGTRKQINDELTQHPNLSAYWFGMDTMGQAAGQAVAARYPGKVFPDRPLVATFHADKSTQVLIRKGFIDVVIDNNYDATAWVGIDQLAGWFASKKPLSKAAQPKYPVEYMHYTVVTKANLPKPGTYVEPKDDYVAFFKAKWKQEYGVG